MSNEIMTMLQNSVASVHMGLDEDTRAVAGNSGNKRISIDGGVFRKMAGGKEIASVEDRFMHIIFVKMAHAASRTYYAQTFKKGVKTSPSCWSQDAKTPSPEVKEPAARSCNECPNSAKGSGQGGMGTACRISWRTAVVLPGDPSGDVMQLVLPATSCFGEEDAGRWPFRPYIQMLANNNVSAQRIVTKMQFDTKASVPRLLFSPISPIEESDVAVIASQNKSMAAEKAIKLTVYQSDEGDSLAVPAFMASQPIVDKVVQYSEEEVAEPVLRESAKNAESSDASAVISKWKKK